jgi:hypothetical protein
MTTDRTEIMASPIEPVVTRIRGLGALALTALGLAALLGACSSAPASASRPPASRPVSAAVVRATCTQVSDVLSDGPDPDADPVGYAEAQILPLGQIRTSDAQLRAAIGRLAGAYRAFFASDGTSSTAKLAVASATKRINAFCPGAAS